MPLPAACKANTPWQRWLGVVLRGLHLVAVILLGIGLFGQATTAEVNRAAFAVLASGGLLWALDIWTKPDHLRQMAGLSMFAKLVLVGAMVLWPSLHAALFWLVVVWSAVFSHAPASFRNAPILGRGHFLSRNDTTR